MNEVDPFGWISDSEIVKFRALFNDYLDSLPKGQEPDSEVVKIINLLENGEFSEGSRGLLWQIILKYGLSRY